MITKIKENYDAYKQIYTTVLPTFGKSEVDKQARILLENSLYLSVFTTFESFIKDIIENYIDNITESETGLTYTHLTEGFARAIFLSEEKRINYIFSASENKQTESFRSYFNLIKNKLSRKQIETHVRFEFLHKNKLNSYYKDLFELLAGDKDLLLNLKITENSNDFDGLLDVKGDALTFLSEYTDKIRNSIAHQNQEFFIDGFDSFEKIVDSFFLIIETIVEKYEKHTNFKFEKRDKNIITNFY